MGQYWPQNLGYFGESQRCRGEDAQKPACIAAQQSALTAAAQKPACTAAQQSTLTAAAQKPACTTALQLVALTAAAQMPACTTALQLALIAAAQKPACIAAQQFALIAAAEKPACTTALQLALIAAAFDPIQHTDYSAITDGQPDAAGRTPTAYDRMTSEQVATFAIVAAQEAPTPDALASCLLIMDSSTKEWFLSLLTACHNQSDNDCSILDSGSSKHLQDTMCVITPTAYKQLTPQQCQLVSQLAQKQLMRPAPYQQLMQLASQQQLQRGDRTYRTDSIIQTAGVPQDRV